MAKTIEELRQLASIIEEATRRGENTQLRVGGLFNDIIDFIGQIPVTETILGPLLQALNNSELLNPGDGQTLTFSLMKDGWTFSDALTQLQIKLGQISSTVTSNYETFLRVKDQLQQEVDDTDQRVRSYKTDYDNDKIEYSTWRSQTDTSIQQHAVAIDRQSGQIVSISSRVDTAYDQLDRVTNNLEASDKALNNLLNLTGLDYDDPPGTYTASWLYKNRQGIYGAAATFDENGNILQSSKLQVTVNGLDSRVETAEGQVSLISQTVNQISARVEDVNRGYSEIRQTVDSIIADVQDLEGNVGRIEVTANRAYQRVTSVEGDIAEMGVELEKKVTNDGMVEYVTHAHISADQIDMKGSAFRGWFDDYIDLKADNISFDFKNQWIVSSDGVEVMRLTTDGDLYLNGKFHGEIDATTTLTDGNLVIPGTNTRIVIGTVANYACVKGLIGRTGSESEAFSLDLTQGYGKLSFLDSYVDNSEVYLENGLSKASLTAISGSAGASLTLRYGGYSNWVSLSADNKGVSLSGIPTSKPSDSGYLYWDSDTLKKS